MKNSKKIKVEKNTIKTEFAKDLRKASNESYAKVVEQEKKWELKELQSRLIEILTLSMAETLTLELLKEQTQLQRELKKLQGGQLKAAKEIEIAERVKEAGEILVGKVNLVNEQLHEGEGLTKEIITSFAGELIAIAKEVRSYLPRVHSGNGMAINEPTPEREQREFNNAIEFLANGGEMEELESQKRNYRAYVLFNEHAKKYTELIANGKTPTEATERRYIAVNQHNKI